MAAQTPGFELKLRNRQEVAERTFAFRFDKPAGWSFTAGQSIDMSLINPPETDAEGNTRAYSLASSPNEGTLMIATRMRESAFKRMLGGMPLETSVRIEGPFGNMTLHNNARRGAIILTGGIGITPFRSIIFHATQEKLPHKIVLLYSNRCPEDAAFLKELQALQNENQNYKFIPTMTAMQTSRQTWQGESGRIDREMLARHTGTMNSPVYYIAGPPGMVSGLRAMLKQTGVDDDDIRSEEFAGY